MAETTETSPEPAAAAEPDVPDVVGVQVTITTGPGSTQRIQHDFGRSWDNRDGDLMVWDKAERPVAEYRDGIWRHVMCVHAGDD